MESGAPGSEEGPQPRGGPRRVGEPGLHVTFCQPADPSLPGLPGFESGVGVCSVCQAD